MPRACPTLSWIYLQPQHPSITKDPELYLAKQSNGTIEFGICCEMSRPSRSMAQFISIYSLHYSLLDTRYWDCKSSSREPKPAAVVSVLVTSPMWVSITAGTSTMESSDLLTLQCGPVIVMYQMQVPVLSRPIGNKKSPEGSEET
jgi:hypothetical protein